MNKEQQLIVARVIYSEASPICSREERYFVTSVIINRIRHIGFGSAKLLSMYDVVTQKGAFSCIDDPKNSNWSESSRFPTEIDKITNDFPWSEAWKMSLEWSVNGLHSPIKNIVYYHDNSISKPKSWDNKYWRSFLHTKTERFSFYNIKPNK